MPLVLGGLAALLHTHKLFLCSLSVFNTISVDVFHGRHGFAKASLSKYISKVITFNIVEVMREQKREIERTDRGMQRERQKLELQEKQLVRV